MADFDAKSWVFTPAAVERAISYARSESGRWVWRDASREVRGLHLVVGERTAVWMARLKLDGKAVSRRLGDAEGPAAMSLAEARERANQARWGKAGLTTVKRRRTRTVGLTGKDLWEAYRDDALAGRFSLRSRRLTPISAKTMAGYASLWKAHLADDYGHRDAGHLLEDATTVVTKIGRKGAALGNIAIAVLSNLATYARRQGLYDGPNPCKGGDIARFDVPRRELTVDATTIEAITRGLQATTPYWRDLFLLAAYTGKRLGNIRTLRWDQVDAHAKVIRWPAEVVKNRRGLTTPITAGVAGILRERRRAVPEGASVYVFPSNRDSTKPATNPHHAWEKVRTASGLPGVVIHHLRHVATTVAVRACGVPAAAELVGHADHRSTETYLHLDAGDAKAPAQAVEAAWAKASKAVAKRSQSKGRVGKIGKPEAPKGVSK